MKHNTLRLLAVIYAAVLLVAAAGAALRQHGRTACAPQPLSTETAQLKDVRTDHPDQWANFGPGSMVTTSWDTYLVWQVDAPVHSLQMQVRSSQPIRDPQVYYTTAPGEDWSARRVLPLVESDPAKGVYRFALPRTVPVQALRLDPTSSAGAFFVLEEITLNPTPRGLPLTAGEVLALAVLPLLAVLAVQELAALRRR